VAHAWNNNSHTKYLLPIKMYAHTSKYSRPWKYLRIHKISAPHQECSRLIIYDSNKAAVEIFAANKRCMRPQMLASKLLLFGLSRISNFWLLLRPAEDLSLRWCCLSSMQSSSGNLLSDRPAYMGGVSAVLYRLVVPAQPVQIFASCPIFAAANISTFFLGICRSLGADCSAPRTLIKEL
jgi:hypothetical protein